MTFFTVAIFFLFLPSMILVPLGIYFWFGLDSLPLALITVIVNFGITIPEERILRRELIKRKLIGAKL